MTLADELNWFCLLFDLVAIGKSWFSSYLFSCKASSTFLNLTSPSYSPSITVSSYLNLHQKEANLVDKFDKDSIVNINDKIVEIVEAVEKV